MLLAALAVTAAPFLSGPAGTSPPSDAGVLVVADYAFVTADHSVPRHVVTAADLLNAAEAEASSVETANLSLGANIGDIQAYPRLAIFMNSATYKQTCVNFPATVGERPQVITCPAKAVAIWQNLPFILDQSSRAVAAAESKGRAVAGADITPFFAGSNIHVVGAPSFKAGQGGVVRFTFKMKTGRSVTSAYVCVRFAKTEAGVPVQVRC
jgi:hypothetical protein